MIEEFVCPADNIFLSFSLTYKKQQQQQHQQQKHTKGF